LVCGIEIPLQNAEQWHVGRGTRRQVCGLRVLLVEDEMMVALLPERMLVELGHQVAGHVARLERGLEIAERDAIDLAAQDVNINGTEVYPIAAALEARGIPFIFATGYSSAGLHPPYRNRPILQKPYRSDDLKAAIGRACDRSQTQAPLG
jgi:CheY-like chemotaxis protein